MSLFSGVSDAVSAAADAVASTASAIADGIGRVITKARDAANQAIDWMIDKAKSAGEAISKAAAWLFDKAKQVFGAVKAFAVKVACKIKEKLKGPPKTPFEQNKQKAIDKIKNSKFGQTAEGKKVVKKIEDLDKSGKIVSKKMGSGTRGQWSSGGIEVNSDYDNDPDAIASELVHEATHAVNEDEFPASKTKLTIDEEMRTNENQLDFYEEQRADGFRDPELENRRNDRAAGKLRDNVRKRYPKAPEHL